MACACKVNRDIELLKKNYGVGNKKSDVKFDPKYFIKSFILLLIKILISPFLFIILIINMIFSSEKGHAINLNKIIKRNRKVSK